MAKKISFIIVYFNAPDILLQCIRSILNDSNGFFLEFLIIDNSSNVPEDEVNSLDIVWRKIESGYNSGFSRGVNLGLKHASGDYIFIINQDAFLFENNTLNRIIGKIDALPGRTVYGCKIINPAGEFQQSVWIDNPGFAREWRFSAINYKMNPKWKLSWRIKVDDAHKNEGFVYRLNAAFLVIDKSKTKQIPYFDPDFFLYGEDVEWAIRIKRNGWVFYFDPTICIKHYGSLSTRNDIKKEAQIMLSGWLVILKTKGRIFLFLFILYFYINYLLDAVLDKLKRNRLSKASESKDSFNKRQMIKSFLLKKYGTKVLFAKKLSNEKTFLFNCYDEDINID